MTPDLVQQMSAELRALRDRYRDFLNTAFIADLEDYAQAAQKTCDKQRMAPGPIDPALDMHLKNTSNLMGEILYGNLFAEAYGHVAQSIRERYDALERQRGAGKRHEDAVAQAETRAGGIVGSALEPDPAGVIEEPETDRWGFSL